MKKNSSSAGRKIPIANSNADHGSPAWLPVFAMAAIAAIAARMAASVTAAEISLDGEWESCFRETGEIPAANAQWTRIQVPSLVSRNAGRPFLWYRRNFEVPEIPPGERLFLRIGGSRYVTKVYVNGREVGGHYGGWEPFEVEITAVIQPAESNRLLVCAQDVTGVIAEDLAAKSVPRGVRFIDLAEDSVMAPIGSQDSNVGIWQPVTLCTRGDVFLEDIFVKTSVRKKRIAVDYTLRNLSTQPKTVTLASRVDGANLRLGGQTITVPAEAAAPVTLELSWPEPRLWGPEDPHLYTLVSRIEGENASQGETRTRFGFREFWTEGDRLILNGTPMRFLATAGHPRGALDGELGKEAALDFYRRIREANCVAMRLHANVWPQWWYEAADECGMPLILESALFCWARSYALSKDEFWKNYRDHLEAILKAHRNHPSVVMISLENEILHCGGNRVPETEHRLAEAGRFVRQLDPTRPILYDGDGDPEGVADVINLHYPLDFNRRNLWPEAGRWLDEGMVVSGWPHTFFRWDRKKPLYFGEYLHLQHFTQADPYSVLLGDGAYVGHREAMAHAKAAAWEMQTIAYRVAGVSGLCPWTLTESGEFPSDDNPRYLAVKHAYQPNGAFVREYDTRFFSGEQVNRTVDVFNDTLHRAALRLEWKLEDHTENGRAVVDAGEERFELPPAGQREIKLVLKMPATEGPAPLSFSLTVWNGERRAFQDEKKYRVFPRRPLEVPDGIRIALFERQDGRLARAFTEAGVRPLEMSNLAEIPPSEVLVIGPHALDAMTPEKATPVVGGRSGTRQAIAAFVREGGTVIALEQDRDAHDLLPSRLVDRGATIAFPRSRAEWMPATLKEASGQPFSFWRGDHVVARKTIAKPAAGRFRALVDSGGPDGLIYVALMEALEGRGRYLLSQLAIGEKLDSEPAARLMFEGLLRRAAQPPDAPARLAVVQETLPLADRLGELDVLFTDLSGRLAGADLGAYGVLLAEAGSREVAENIAGIRSFVEAGGRAILHGGTPDAIRRIRDLFSEPIHLQSAVTLPVTIAEPDPVIDGLSNQELYWYGDRDGFSWREQTPLSPAVAHYAVSEGEPDPARAVTVEAEEMSAVEGAPRREPESVYLWRTGSLEKTVTFPEPGRYTFAIRAQGTPCAGVYPQLDLAMDGKRCGGVSTSEDWGVYFVTADVAAGERTLRLSFVNDASNPETGEDRNVRVDSLSFGPTLPMASKRLLAPAALVKSPLGRGFFLIDQVRWAGDDSNPEKADRYISNLLTNLDCPFGAQSASLTIAPASMEPKKEFRFTKQDDGAAYLGSNGTIACRVRFAESGRYQFLIRAGGTAAGGELPNLRVGLAGKTLGDLPLQKTQWHSLRLEAEVAGGEHELTLSFTNDFYDPPEDRNLRIQSLVIRPGED